MSIHDQTIKQLVRNRVHDLADMVLDMQIVQQRQAVLVIAPGGISLKEEFDDADTECFYALLPPSTTPDRALEDLEEMVSDVRTHQGQGGDL
ncbi:MAG: hypothetical protein ACQEUY_13225 [Pseudomonadota bacterium]